MDSIRYVHAADLHLDAAFKGAASLTGDVAPFREATFTALERLTRLCEREKPDFLVLAGDIYNQEDRSLKAQIALRDACQRLCGANVRVFVAHGNHDPLSSRLAALEWPKNVTFFGETPEAFPVYKNGEQAALVHGISHAHPEEGRNLAKLFRRVTGTDVFQLGVLHGALGDYDRYAPFTIPDLVETGLDAWALGHIHKRQILAETPFIAYSGNTQGLHINERGPKGCYLATASRLDEGWRVSAEFRPLAPARWELAEIDVSKAKTLDDVERLIEAALAGLRENVDPGCLAVAARLALAGATDLDCDLRKAETQDMLADRLRYLADRSPAMLIKDFKVETRPQTSPENYLDRDDLAGEVARICKNISQNHEELEKFAKSCLDPLFGNPRLSGLLGAPDGEKIAKILEEAQRLCIERLEKP